MTETKANNLNRSNSFVSSLKWWPLQGHNNQSTNNNITTPTTNGHNQQPHHNQHHSNGGVSSFFHLNFHHKTGTFGSSVAIQKLRESKWFKRDEQRIFCAVVECGFIVEVRECPATETHPHQTSFETERNHNDDDDDEEEQDENQKPVTSWFGIVLCKTTKDHKPKPETIEIYSIKIRENGTFKMIKTSLEDIWSNDCELRINNFADKEKQPHSEKDIRNQVSFARKAKQSLWNNNKHFVYWCRYGSRQQDVRKRQMSECVKWGSVGMNAGMLLVMNKQKSYSTSK